MATLLLPTACQTSPKEPRLTRYQDQFLAGFDTLTTLVAYEASETVFQEHARWIQDRITHYDQLFTAFESYPGVHNVYYLNQHAGEAPVVVDPDLFALLRLSLEVAEASDGAFNPCLGQLSALWKDAAAYSRQHPDRAYIPEKAKREEAMRHIDFHKLRLDADNSSVYFEDPHLQLDLGGIAKGFACEKIITEMREAGLDHYLLSMGGNVKSLGKKAQGEDWQIGIQDPFDRSNLVDTVVASDLAVVTSGIYERNFFVREREYHHILDPQTGMPSDRYVSVSIVLKDSGLADALSTALFSMDQEPGKMLAERYGAGVLWILPNADQIKLEK